MRVLFLTSQFPQPMRSGATIKTATLIEYLRQRHELHLACLRSDELDDRQREWASQFARFDSVQLNRGRNPWNLARSYVASLPLSIERNRTAKMTALVERIVADGAFDAVFVDGWLMAQYLPAGFDGLKLLHEHNAEYVIWDRQATLERNPLLSRLLTAEAARVREYEAAILSRFDVVCAVSVVDQLAIEAIGPPDLNVRILPNVADPELLKRAALAFSDGPRVVLYLGTMSWQPNLEGIDRFLREVWPLVRRQAGDARLVIAGQGAPGSLRRLAGRGKGIEFVPEFDDADDLYRKARVFIEATRSGGGTKVKLLNALARGLPVVASLEACEGLAVVPGEHALVEGTSPAMAAGIIRLFDDEKLWGRLSDNGRKLVSDRYVPDVAYAVLDQVLSDAPASV
ncbi:MAG: glycosyltransferase family 4 protein [Dehalococcoidia bacterium]